MLEISDLPLLNATLNALAGILLVSAYVMIRKGNVVRHRALMLAAFSTSVLFLVSYVCLLYTSPSPRDATLSRMPSCA